MGGLILVFVFFMEQGLQSSSLPSIPSQHTPTQSGPAPVVTNPTPSPAVEVSPTATLFPAQRYIDSAQMASSVSPTSAQATSLATAFHINTKIYVTFHIHSGGQAGAACILWYLNGTKILNYSFAIAANAGASYSYAFYRGTGAGYVAIYWASSTQCTDQLLAQEVNFTVTP